MALKPIISSLDNQIIDSSGNTVVSRLDDHFIISSDTTLSVGDILRIKDGTDDEWFKVNENVSGSTSYEVWRDMSNAYGVTTLPAWKKGTSFVNYKQATNGGIYMTASDSDAPYLDVITHNGEPWSSVTTKVRLGNLTGITDSEYGVLSGYGLYSDNVYLKGSLYSPTIKTAITGARLELTTSQLIAYDDSENTVFNILISGDNVGDVIIGDEGTGTNYCKWDKSAGTFVVRGTLSADDLTAGTLSVDRIGAHTITASKIAANTITASEIAANTITASEIAANTITASEIAANTITASEIAANTITASEIASGTITATELKGTAFGTLTISSGKIVINTTDALEIQSAGNIKCLAGSDINLIGDSSNQGRLNFVGTSYSSSMFDNLAGDTTFFIPTTTSVTHLEIGDPSHVWDGITFCSDNTIFLYANSDGSNIPYIRILPAGAGAQEIDLACDFVLGYGNKGTDMGSAGIAFDDMYADDFNNVADFPFLDVYDDLQTIKDIKQSNKYDNRTGLPLIDDDTLPNWLLVKNKNDVYELDKETGAQKYKTANKGDIARDTEGKPYLSLKTMVSLCMGAIKQVDNKIDLLDERLIKLENKK